MWSNLIPLVVAAALLTVLLRARSQPLWAESYRRIGRNPIALIALAIIVCYGTIAFLDSLIWQDNKKSAPRSVVDRIFERAPERTYSAPLATMTTGEPKPHPLKAK